MSSIYNQICGTLSLAKRTKMKTIFYFTTVLFLTHISVHAQDQKDSTAVKKDKQIIKKTMKFKIPSSLQEEHKELHHTLEKFTQLPGKTGIAAKEVAKLLHPHFIKEEEYATGLTCRFIKRKDKR
jgi:hypothetical protein